MKVLPCALLQCCGVKAANNLTDTICYALTACGDWAVPEQYTDCCVGKTAAVEYDETCPVVAGECITYAPGADKEKCCADKQAAGLYDAACPITDACSTYPPQNRYTCCQVRGWAPFLEVSLLESWCAVGSSAEMWRCVLQPRQCERSSKMVLIQ